MVNLGPLIDHAPAWLMVLFRLTGIFLLAPLLGSSNIPRQIKLFFALGLSLCVYPMLLMRGHSASPALEAITVNGLNLWTLSGSIAVELLLGYVIGYCASLPLVGMQLGGHVLDQQMGVSAGGVFNPDLDAEAGVVGQLLFLSGLAVFMIVGGHHVMLTTLIGSFERVPIGMFGSDGVDMSMVLDLVVGLMTIMFEMGLKIAAPLLCIVFLQSIAMGFIARTVPQMNILSIGFIVRILGGLAILVVGIETAMSVFRASLFETLQHLMAIFTM